MLSVVKDVPMGHVCAYAALCCVRFRGPIISEFISSTIEVASGVIYEWLPTQFAREGIVTGLYPEIADESLISEDIPES